MLTFENFTKVITQERNGKKIPEISHYVYKWQDMKIIISRHGRGLNVTCVNQFDEVLYARDGSYMEENTEMSLFELKNVSEMWVRALRIANTFYEEKRSW